MGLHKIGEHEPFLDSPLADGQRLPNRSGSSDAYALRVYENEIPPFVEVHLEKLYDNIYCSLARLRLYESMEGISTFVASDGNDIRFLILFRLFRGVVKVVNQQIELREHDIACFANEIFAVYPGVRRIEFYALNCTIHSSAFQYLYQQIQQLEENVIEISGNGNDYLRQLGSKTRCGIQKYMRKTVADYPSYRFEVFAQDRVTIDLVSAVVRLTEMRMKFKHKPSYLGADSIATLAKLARTHGYITTITIDGEICAANLCFKVRDRHFAQVIAHDPRFNQYALGHQLNLQSILYSISDGAKEIWMMGGRSEEKARFHARQRFLNSIVVYRTRFDALCSWPTFIRIVLRKRAMSARQFLRKKSLENNNPGRFVARLVHLTRHARAVVGKASHVAWTFLAARRDGDHTE